MESCDLQKSPGEISAVTGAFGFSGKYIAGRLLKAGQRVRTLTNHPDPGSPLLGHVEVRALDLRNPDNLAKSLVGVNVLYNTYWVRFAHGDVNHDIAVENSRRLVQAAERAGVQRIVHVSITNPSPSSPLPYFRGKAEVEEAIRASRLSYAILRPAVLFGDEDILINNIAWLLRRFPIFAVPGEGEYRVQPIFVEDLARLALEAGQQSDNLVMDAVGPEIYPYNALLQLIRTAVGSHSRIIHLPAPAVVLASKLLSYLVHDVVLTKDEVAGLTADLLVSQEAPTGTTPLSAWLQEHRETIGRTYASELKRHYRASRRASVKQGELRHF